MARKRRGSSTGGNAVSERFLLEGFWYSVEQSGRLLHQATALCEAGYYGTALGVALLGIEELGKGRILRDFWKQAQAGTPVTLERIRHTLDDHPRKLKAGQTIYPFTAAPGTVVADVVQKSLGNLDTPEARREAVVTLASFALELGKRTPHERHAARERAFYVDPDSTGTVWRRPSETTQGDAEDLLLMAMNDYVAQVRFMENPQGEVAEAVEAWSNRPHYRLGSGRRTRRSRHLREAPRPHARHSGPAPLPHQRLGVRGEV